MSQLIFPFELAYPSVETLSAKTNRQSQVIYLFVLGLFFLSIGVLPVIKIKVGGQAPGVIRDVQDNTLITALIQGQVIAHNLVEDRPVAKGQKLISLNTGILDAEREKLLLQIEEAENAWHDLAILLLKSEQKPALRTSVYQQAFSQYSREFSNLDIKKQYLFTVLERVHKLYKEHVVAKVDFEKAQLDADLSASELRLLEEQQRKSWELESQQVHQQLLDLKSKLALLERQSKDYAIYAPCDGILVQTTGLKPGSYVMPGQQLAFISTHDSLLAEIHIPTAQIGYIRRGMPVSLQVDAYNYHEWGAISGTVHQVPNEVKIINETPVFVTQVKLHQKELKLKNGYVGKLKKGMIIRAQFFLQKRSLFALLYDKAEDWLDPRNI
ncbi:HlyD family secretion protein [Haliscomenobacter hydrossis]|uniref:Secretion protein HlyD family protein n=1 Tax=Haliscomenobacter hydrossis (strain ATCC 27775 / DSM 1100 / LMG 10767 / O) TaxID=760192 RepID=F4KYM1_HALH1|nr:HlyD family efflux transporter periplasmic adaptor subunit [Haliscomenobacter hydrossis]AEE50427.1 secretion protein HlyD family protein [Haliscomenobacter hydrossis DSM 1100]